MPQPVLVLVADDEPQVRQLFADIFDGVKGVQLLFAQNGAEAVTLAQRAQPRVVFLDIRMPVMNGVDAAVNIRRVCPAAQVYLISGCHEEYDTTIAHQAGVSDVIRKPFDVDGILRCVALANQSS